ncbi:MAG: ROK family protein [Deltaproteobacteria bacterium]|nr:ROK family protein [Deltaproteobacteria bacterium]
MKVLVIDVGGTHIKILAAGQKVPQKFVSGPTMTAKQMVSGVKKLTKDWNYDAVSIGYPGPVVHGRIIREPYNLGPGWIKFDFKKAFGCPVEITNDAAMQALGSYKGGNMLFLGLGTGLGSAMIVDGLLQPMELGHLPYRKGTYEDYVGTRGLRRFGKKKWRKFVVDVVERLAAAMEPDDVVLGGGNVKRLQSLPNGCRRGDNANAFVGGFRLWTPREKFFDPRHRAVNPSVRKASQSAGPSQP